MQIIMRPNFSGLLQYMLNFMMRLEIRALKKQHLSFYRQNNGSILGAILNTLLNSRYNIFTF